MTSDNKIFRKLQQHLNKQPIGFPRALFRSDIRLLKHHFSREEAGVALEMSYRYDSLDEIYLRVGRSGIPLDKLRIMLFGLSERGSIGYRKTEEADYFCLVPLVVGMYEGKVFALNSRYLKDVKRYQHSVGYGASLLSTEIPQMRTIPVEKSIIPDHRLPSYDDIAAIIEATDGPIVVIECICRKAEMLKGNSCKMTKRLETCMTFHDVARALTAFGKGRRIDKRGALAIMKNNQEDGLVLQAFNTQVPDAVCSCCGCCCGMLGLQKLLPNPVDFWAANFHAAVDREKCTGCGLCANRCQVGAVKFYKKKKRIDINLRRCIGCGNCAANCALGAMRLVRNDRVIVPPRTYDDMQETIMKHKERQGPGRVVKKILARIT